MKRVWEIVHDTARRTLWLTRPVQDREDLASTVFVALIERLQRRKCDPKNLDALVSVSAKKQLMKCAKIIDEHRRNITQIDLGMNWHQLQSHVRHDRAWTIEQLGALENAVTALPEDQKTAIRKYFSTNRKGRGKDNYAFHRGSAALKAALLEANPFEFVPIDYPE